MAYTAADVKNLRERTGAGMMDCKKALEDTAGDFEAAVDALRAKGLAAAAKKSSRTAAEGLVGVAVNGTKGVAVEVNSEGATRRCPPAPRPCSARPPARRGGTASRSLPAPPR